MKKAHNKVLTVILTALLLIGAMPFTVGAQERFQEFHIPNIDTVPNGELEFNETWDAAVAFTHKQSYSRLGFKYVEITGTANFHNYVEEIEYSGITLYNCAVFVGRCDMKLTKTDDTIVEYTDVSFQMVKGNIRYLDLYQVCYGIMVDWDINNYEMLLMTRNLMQLFPNEMQMFYIGELVTDGFTAYLDQQWWDELPDYPSGLTFYNYMTYLFIPYKPLFDQYTFKDYLKYENDIIESAQTGITEWTTNPTVFLVICIIMGVVLTYILFTSLKEWFFGRRY